MKTEILEEKKVGLLDHLKETARRSYYWISQNPEGRGERCLAGWNEEIADDIEKLKAFGAGEEQIDRYKKDYEKMLCAWYASQANTASSFVCGPANFPVARQEKKHRWAQNHYDAFRAFRVKVFKAYERHDKKAKIEAAGGELEINRKKLADLQATHEYMKKINAAHKAYLKKPQSLELTDLSEAAKKIIIQYVPAYSWEKHPFAPYQITNSNKNIKNTEDRIKVLEAKEQSAEQGNREIAFEGGKIILNTEIDRLQIMHAERPGAEVIAALKKNGFRWSPFSKSWQRQLTDNAKIATERILTGIKF